MIGLPRQATRPKTPTTPTPTTPTTPRRRADAAAVAEPIFWGGGTVSLATSADDFRVLKCRPSDRLEDGTVAFLDVAALKHGFAALEGVGGTVAIRAHVAALSRWLWRALSALRHANGAPMVTVFGLHEAAFSGADGGDKDGDQDTRQGGIFNFEILRPDGRAFAYKTVEREAAAAGLHLRSGQACAPGAALFWLGLQEREVEALAGKKEGCEDDVESLSVRRDARAVSAGLRVRGPDLPAAEGEDGGAAAAPTTLVGQGAEGRQQQQQQWQQWRQAGCACACACVRARRGRRVGGGWVPHVHRARGVRQQRGRPVSGGGGGAAAADRRQRQVLRASGRGEGAAQRCQRRPMPRPP